MAFNKQRLKQGIKNAMESVKDMTENPAQAREVFAEIIATAIEVEIENIEVEGVCPPNGGALTEGKLI